MSELSMPNTAANIITDYTTKRGAVQKLISEAPSKELKTDTYKDTDGYYNFVVDVSAANEIFQTAVNTEYETNDSADFKDSILNDTLTSIKVEQFIQNEIDIDNNYKNWVTACKKIIRADSFDTVVGSNTLIGELETVLDLCITTKAKEDKYLTQLWKPVGGAS